MIAKPRRENLLEPCDSSGDRRRSKRSPPRSASRDVSQHQALQVGVADDEVAVAPPDDLRGFALRVTVKWNREPADACSTRTSAQALCAPWFVDAGEVA